MRRLRLAEHLLVLSSRRGAQQQQQLGAGIAIGDSSSLAPGSALLAAFRSTLWRAYSSSAIKGEAKSPSSVRRTHALAEEVAIAPSPSASRRSKPLAAPVASTSAAPAAPKAAKTESSSPAAKEKKSASKAATTTAETKVQKSPTERSTATATTAAKEARSSLAASKTKTAAAAAAPKAADRWLTASSSSSLSSSAPRDNNSSSNKNNRGGGGGNRAGQQQNQQQRRDPWRLGEGDGSNYAAAGRHRPWGNQNTGNNSNRQRQPWGNNYNNQRQQQQQTMQQHEQQEQRKNKKKPSKPAAPPPPLPPLVIPVGVTSLSLSRLLGVSLEQLNTVLASIDASPPSEEDPIEPDAAELAALELLGGDEVSSSSSSSFSTQQRPRRTVVIERPPDDDSSNAAAEVAPRPPVVAVLGHVDHGKTSLLDALRKTAVAAGEAGGITQATGAFEVSMPQSNSTITFLDTPGHAAFAAMRARGAAMTDVAVVVVDARDGVKPQTREAIAHVKSAGVAFVVAITKCDLPDADPSAVRRQLLGEGVELEEVGGSVQVVEVAAIKGQGLRELEEALLLQAELLELKAPRKGLPGSPTEAVVVEARLAQGHGPVATVIVRRGTLEPGQIVAIGREWGKIRSLTDAKGDKNAKGVFPGHAAEVAGLRGVPIAGDRLVVLPTEERARALASARAAAAADAKRNTAAAAVGEQRRKAEEDAAAAAAAAAAASPVKVGRRSSGKAAAAQAFADAGEAAGEGVGSGNDPSPHQVQSRRLLLVIKADTQGAIEALEEALVSLSTVDVPVRVSSSGVGPVTLSDVQHAAAVGGRVLAYGSASAARGGGAAVEREARRLGVPLSCHRVIYHAIDAVAAAVAGAAPPVAREAVAGQAEVLAVFASGGGGGGSGSGRSSSSVPVAGLKVVEGAILKSETFRVLRGGKVIHDNLKALTLRRHKLDVERVGAGTECGLVLERGSSESGGSYDPRPGDVVQCVTVEWVSPSAAEVTEAAEAKKQAMAHGSGAAAAAKAAGKKRGAGRSRKVEL